MPSPTCEVKEGAGAYQATTNGVNVAANASTTIHLVSSAGVNAWSIECIGTDELSSAATVNAGLTVDSGAKTAAFTYPNATGRALIFRSKVNNGLDVNGAVDASLTTTFGIYSLVSSRRCHAINETFESDSTFGWVAGMNDIIRTGGGGTPGGSDTQVQYNNGGAFGGMTGLLYDDSTNRAQLVNPIEFKNGANLGALTMTPTASRTITVPDVTGTVAILDAAQTLTNKTIAAGSNTITALANANVDAAAAIAGTKIDPAFGSQNVSTSGNITLSGASSKLDFSSTGFVEFGTNPSTTGSIRFPSDGRIYNRNSANSADLGTIGYDGSNNLVIGDNGNALSLMAGSTCELRSAGDVLLTRNGGQITFGLFTASGSINSQNGTNTFTTAFARTTDATVTTLYSLTLPANSAACFEVILLARDIATDASAFFRIGYGAYRAGGGATETGTVDVTSKTAALAAAATADISGNDMRIRITGIAATTIDWQAQIRHIVN